MYTREKYETKEELSKAKEGIISSLAELESKNWNADPEVAASIFPYVLIEAINLLKNSEIIENPIDYTSTGENATNMIKEILSN